MRWCLLVRMPVCAAVRTMVSDADINRVSLSLSVAIL